MAQEHDAGRSATEPDSHAFVLRVWREDGARRPEWRGQITHVGSGARRAVRHLGEIGLFVGGYVERMGTPLSWVWRLRRWLGRAPR
jgi:hypothetical protein